MVLLAAVIPLVERQLSGPERLGFLSPEALATADFKVELLLFILAGQLAAKIH